MFSYYNKTITYGQNVNKHLGKFLIIVFLYLCLAFILQTCIA